jgi:hypothetical protein
MTDDVEVKLGADSGELKNETNAAAQSVEASLKQIADALSKFSGQSAKTTQEAIKNNADLSRSFLELRGSLTGGFNAITGVVERFRGVLTGLAGALAGGFIGKESVDALMNLEQAVRGLQIQFGMTAEAATLLNVNLSLAGISAQTFEAMGMRVMRVLRTQSGEFDRLGVSTKDANGNLLPMDQILQNVYKRMQDFKAGTDQQEFALATVGRGAAGFADDMERLSRTQERAKQVMADLGIEMGPERQAEVENYRVEMNAFKLGLEEIEVRIGEALMPTLKALAAWFDGEGPTAVTFMSGALKGFATAITVIGAVFQYVGESIGNTIGMIVRGLQLFVQGVEQAAHADFAGIGQTAQAAFANVAEWGSSTADSIVKTAADAAAKIKAIWADAEQKGKASAESMLPKSGSETFKPKPTGGGAGTQMSIWSDQLEQMKQFAGEEDSYLKSTTALELSFWQQRLATISGSGKQAEALRRDVHARIFALEKQAAAQEQAQYMADGQYELAQLKNHGAAKVEKLKEIAAEVTRTYGEGSAQAISAQRQVLDAERAVQDEERKNQIDAITAKTAHEVRMLELEKQRAQGQLALHRITATQELQIEKELDDQIYELRRAAYQKQLGLMSGDQAAQKEAKDQLLKIEDDHAKAVEEREQKAAEASQKVWESAFGTITNAVAQSVIGIERGTTTAMQAVNNFVNAVTSECINALVKLAAQWIQTEAQMQMSGAGGNFGGIGGILSAIGFGGGGGGDTLAGLAGGSGNAWQQQAALAVLGGFEKGTDYVPTTGLYLMHRGEKVTPAGSNTGAGVTVINNFNNFNGDTRSQQQIAAGVGQTINRAMSRNT